MDWDVLKTIGYGLYSLYTGVMVFNLTRMARQGHFRRVWNRPMRTGLALWGIGFLLAQVPWWGGAGACFFGGFVSLVIFVAGFVSLMVRESRRAVSAARPDHLGGA